MKQETYHHGLSKLGEELLQEFDTAQPQAIPLDFDRKCRKTIGRKNQIGHLFLWVARAAVTTFALVGMLSVVVLSVSGLRTPCIQFMVAHWMPEILLEGQEENIPEYEQSRYTTADNVTLSLYYDGKDRYQILWSNEFGQRCYNFLSTDLDAATIWELGSHLSAVQE